MEVYYVYILTNKNNTVLYTGFTNNLLRRMYEHKNKMIEGFTSRYNTDKLVYFEEFESMKSAMKREKKLKAGSRQRKVDLINSINPEWTELLPPEVEKSM